MLYNMGNAGEATMIENAKAYARGYMEMEMARRGKGEWLTFRELRAGYKYRFQVYVDVATGAIPAHKV